MCASFCKHKEISQTIIKGPKAEGVGGGGGGGGKKGEKKIKRNHSSASPPNTLRLYGPLETQEKKKEYD